MSGKSRNSFFEELKQRSVLRVGAGYLVVAWLLVQIADTVFPYIGLSDRIITLIITLLAIGFIPVLIISWVFELTPGGLVRDSEVDRSESAKSRPGLRAFDYVVIVAIAVIAGVYLYDRLGLSSDVGIDANLAPSVAVLPFENRSANADDVYFVDGIHDDILTSLSNIGSMKVISRTSVEQFRDTELTMPEIGDILGVATILEGGVQRAGDRIRINVQLISAATDDHVWAGSWDRDLTTENIFEIQSEIATRIANELRAQLTPNELDRLGNVPTRNLAAYEAYLFGNQRMKRRTLPALEEAIGFFEEAVELDPNFALAYVGLADSHALTKAYAMRSWEEIEPLARAAAERAVELDPGLGEAFASLGNIEFESGNPEEAEPHYQKAIALSPNYATAHQWYGELLGDTGRRDEAFERFKTAAALDPLSPIINYMLGRQYMRRGMLDEGEAAFLQAIEIDPGFARGYEGLALYHMQHTGRLDDGALNARQAIEMGAVSTANFALLANILTMLGDAERAEPWLDEAQARDPNNPNVIITTINLRSLQGDFDAAIEAASHGLQLFPHGEFFAVVIANMQLQSGDLVAARGTIGEFHSELVASDSPNVDRSNFLSALSLAKIEQRAGNDTKAQALTDAASAVIESGFIQNERELQIFRSRIAVLRGQNDEAINILRGLVEDNWNYWAKAVFDFDPVFESLREDPEFIEVRSDWQSGLAAMRASLDTRWAQQGFE